LEGGGGFFFSAFLFSGTNVLGEEHRERGHFLRGFLGLVEWTGTGGEGFGGKIQFVRFLFPGMEGVKKRGKAQEEKGSRDKKPPGGHFIKKEKRWLPDLITNCTCHAEKGTLTGLWGATYRPHGTKIMNRMNSRTFRPQGGGFGEGSGVKRGGGGGKRENT